MGNTPCGPGPPARWPLHHDDRFICRLVDMLKAERIRDAYEVGFRAMKRECVADTHPSFPDGYQPSEKVRGRVEDIVCDMCGEELAAIGFAGWFYFCRRCKQKGQRYELCAGCHACEVLQGKGKHAGAELHPHFLKCSHRSLVRHESLDVAYPDKLHIHRVFC